MIKEAFGKGATTEAAIEAAKNELGAPWDADVKVEVLKTAKKKTLGLFGGSLAEVRAYYEVPDEVKKTEPKPIKEQKPAKQEKKAERKPEAQPKPARTYAPAEPGSVEEKIEGFLKGLLEHMGSDAVPHAYKLDEESYRADLVGGDAGLLIGRRGDTLDAIQYLTGYAINRDREKRLRISVDAGDYRLKREESLRQLANKMAAKAVKYRRNFTLEPMNAYERHIIHAALQDYPEVTTFSTGTEPHRRIVVAYAKEK